MPHSSIQKQATLQTTHCNNAGCSQLVKLRGKKDPLLTLLIDMRQLQSFDVSHCALLQLRKEVLECLSDMFSSACGIGMQEDPRLRQLSDELRNLLNPDVFGKLCNSELDAYVSKLESSPVWTDCDAYCQEMVPLEEDAAAKSVGSTDTIVKVPLEEDAAAKSVGSTDTVAKGGGVEEDLADFAREGTAAKRKTRKGRIPDDAETRLRTQALLSSPSPLPAQAVVHSEDSGWEQEIRNQVILKAKSRQKPHDKQLLHNYLRKGLLSAADEAWLRERPWYQHSAE